MDPFGQLGCRLPEKGPHAVGPESDQPFAHDDRLSRYACVVHPTYNFLLLGEFGSGFGFGGHLRMK